MPRRKVKRNFQLVDEPDLFEENSIEHPIANHHGKDTRTQLPTKGRFQLTSDKIHELIGGARPSQLNSLSPLDVHTNEPAVQESTRLLDEPDELVFFKENSIDHHQGVQTNEHNVIHVGKNEPAVHEATRQESSRQTPLHQPTSQNTPFQQPTSQNADSSSSRHSKKKVRGPTYMSKIWDRPSCLAKIPLMIDKDCNIISGGSHFTEFLGSLARNGIYCPLVKESWSEVESKYKDGILEVINQRYILPPELVKGTLQSIGKKWRTWKAELKAAYYDMSLPVSEAKYHKDERVDEDQWNELWTYWGTDEAKKKSNHCKFARGNKKMNHTTGKKSFAAVRDKLTKDNGRTPTRVEMFKEVYSRADGRPSNSVVAEKPNEMNDKLSELPSDHEDVVSRDDVFSQVTGKDKTLNTKTQHRFVEDETEKVTIKVKHDGDMIKFELCLLLGIVKLFEEVARRLSLKIGSFKLKYIDEDNDEILIGCDDDLQLCPKSQTAMGKTCIQLFVSN